ncbi:hypothetical protein IQ268_20105 [Oculatella sp. LEGE 06141]|uniref:hypothetical protein n=1 Tax=Oculatella sp. LEGE 06141 TaxID=1828648 RepID=UPI00187DF848|nr:hypothetical protein [Oculatella sp. LEGE 06141]MBE9180867.1 hypothetical protein [Oculatella sp. LEGE 06141]
MQRFPMPRSSQIQPRKKRILVLGTALQSPSVTAYDWSNLPNYLNVADYDVIIFNFTSLSEAQFNGRIRPERLPTWQQLTRLLFSPNSEIICIGFPAGETSNSLYQSITWWLPVTPHFMAASGEVIRDIDTEFDYYFEYVRRWFFYATPKFKAHFLGLANYMRVVHPRVNHLRVGMGTIARNRFHQPIAFKLLFRAGYAYPGHAFTVPSNLPAKSAASVEPLLNSGLVIWLPSPTEISADDAIQLILHKRYRLELAPAPPSWIATYPLPEQEAIARKIAKHQQAIQQLRAELEQAQQQLDATSGHQRLLYEQNQDRLTLAVCEGLQELGARIHYFRLAEQVVIRLTAPTGKDAVLDVRSRIGALLLKDIRQLDQAVRDMLLQQNWRGKGILIVNANCRQSPQFRDEPFPPNCRRAAQELGYCLMTTTQLFQAIADYQLNELNITEFWQLVFNTDGVCLLPELMALNEPPQSPALD